MATQQPVNKIIPAYPFVQYSDDPNIVGFFEAYNEMAQGYLDAFNAMALPYWPADIISGYLLDWISEGIYGETRKKIQTSEGSVSKGPYDSVEYNTIPYARLQNYIAGSSEYLADEYFKRILTWNFYKGDGFQFSVPWLKRRVARFLHGPAGIDPILQNTFDVSVTSSAGVFSIAITESREGIASFLKTAIEQGMVKLPFIYAFNVKVNSI
ncbi:hypothetical protein S922_22935 [Salmonella enterica subsp. enterica]|nr:hypothetical protein [Salmonella enterica subsp. enterica]EAW9774266.1 hypothetical protein [Salmonella enterica]